MSKLTVAMAKGRTATMAIDLLAGAGIEFSSYSEASRKLVFMDDTGTVKLVVVKSVDVPTYVENGAADIGVIGKDVLLEEQKDVYEMLDLGISKCKLAVAGFPNHKFMDSSRLTVASKYPKVTKAHFDAKGIRTDIITLNGSIELAPLIGMSDVIVDIVESGKTLKENGLVILEDIADSSARIIVNKASFAIKTKQIQAFIAKVKKRVEVRS
ncbi:ATP phosphoribosyltransferase [Sporosarcina sp. Sa2YVA2]|uniref:ATP phosphoribosyltransferase n=1 Tax=Sporosarcina quadrami TaxID=2762234 RepID=A0ABR8U9T0_9BACL|nr:ATP phosphoribosyltransferase [Sporosarcina quadrami]MBD7984484.1 ATP phosphoribosyltransferase [Sporosarcina quadrami]